MEAGPLNRFWRIVTRKCPCLEKALFVIHVVKLLIANILLVAFDAGSDIYTAIAFHRSGHGNWALATLIPTFLPFFVSTLSTSFNWLRKCCCNSKKTTTAGEGSNSSVLSSAIWDCPIWHFPLLQIANHTRLTLKILKATKVRNEQIKDLRTLSGLKFINVDLVHFLTKNCVDKALKHTSKDLSQSEAEFLSTKMMEAVFESGPQFILQLAIILKVGNVEAHQAATMLISLISFWFSSTQLCLQMPTKKTPIRSVELDDFAITFIPSMTVILSRFAAWSFLVAHMESYILIPMAVALLYTIVVNRKSINFQGKYDIVETFASILVPCVTNDEYSGFYQSGSASTTTVLMAFLLYLFVKTQDINSSPPVTTCFEPKYWTPSLNDTRCLYNVTEDRITQLCMHKLINFGLGFSFENYRTICHNSSSSGYKQTLHLIMCGILIGLLFLGQLLTTYCIQPYLDPLVKLRLTSNWNYFYQTKVNDALASIRDGGDKLSCQEWRRILFSAIGDNIDSLAIYLMARHNNCVNCNKVELLESCLKRCSGNDNLTRAIQSLLSAETANDIENCDNAEHQQDDQKLVTLELKHCKTSIDRLQRKIGDNRTQAPEDLLLEIIRSDDINTFSHYLQCHKHLCSKLVLVYSEAIIGKARLSSLMKLPDIIEKEALNRPDDSQIHIQMKHHNHLCEDMAQTLSNNSSNSDNFGIEMEDDIFGLPNDTTLGTCSIQRIFCTITVAVAAVLFLAWIAGILFILVVGNNFGLQPVNCTWNPWTEWSSCSKTCGSGSYQERVRTVLRTASYGGEECKQMDRSQRQPCLRVPLQCPKGVLGHPLSKAFLEAWRQEVEYDDGIHGKALVQWGKSRVNIIHYISDSSFVYDFDKKGWLPAGKSPRILIDHQTVTVSRGQMIFVGRFQNGTLSGLGSLHISWCGKAPYDQSRRECQSQWNNNQMVGEGWCEYCHGRTDSGTFDKHVLNGPGRRKQANGDLYTGNFKDNEPHGHGQMERTDTSIYTGSWNRGNADGLGQLLARENGSFFVGTFKDNKLDQGQVLSPVRKTFLTGTFQHEEGGNLLADGRSVWPNGDVYEGSFVNALQEDSNATFWEASTGMTYVGRWTKGQPVGIHSRTKLDGTTEKVQSVQADFAEKREWKVLKNT